MRWFATGSRWNTFRWFGDEPMTDAEFLDMMSWERDLSASFSVTITLPSGATVERDRLIPFNIEVRSEHGSLLNTITQYFDGHLRQRLDVASTLNFSVVGTHAAVSNLVFPNRIWLRDRWGMLIEKFLISQYKKRRQGDGIFLDVTCEGAIAALGIEPVKSYNTGFIGSEGTISSPGTDPGVLKDGVLNPKTATVGQIVADLLDLQVQSPAITLKKIDSAIKDQLVVFNVTDTTVLGALRELQAQLPAAIAGHFYLDSKSRFNWRVKVGNQNGETIEVGGRLAGVEYDTNLDDMFTRIYMYGSGMDPETRLTLIDAGEANEYIQDNTGTYGVIPRVVIEKTIRDADQLLEVAERLLEEFSTPASEVTITALDLSKADGDRFDAYNDLCVGGTYRVLDSGQSIDVTVTVTAIDYDFADPIPVRVELKSRRRSLSDLMESILKKLAAPLEIDGDKFPSMGRNYTVAPQSLFHVYRAGDIRVASELPRMHCGFLDPDDPELNWKKLGNAQTWRVDTFADFAALTEDEDGDYGFAADTGYNYTRIGGTFTLAGTAHTWRVATYADFAALTEAVNGDSGYAIDTNYYYIRQAGTFVLLSHAAYGANPTSLRFISPNGTTWYLFSEDDGTVRIHNSVPTSNTSGTMVGTQF